MIEGLQPYPEMQSTGHPWLPSIPKHWDVRRNGRLFSQRRETGYPDLPILEVSLRSGVRIRDMGGGKRKQQIADRSVYQRAVKGDIAYNMMRMWQGAVGIAPADGLVSPAYVVAKAHDGIDAAYYAYLFRTGDYMKEIDSYSRGIVQDRNRLYWQAFKQMPSAYPPLDEQRLIVRFLDWHSAMTGKLIRAKRGVLTLIAEQREVLTREALEHSGTRHVRFSRVADCIFRDVDRSASPQFVTLGLFNRGRGIFRKPALDGGELGQSTFSWVQNGDLIFSGQFAWEGAVAVAGPQEHGCIVSHRYHIVRGNDREASNTYLWCLFRSSLGQLLLDEHSRGAAGRNRPLNINTLMKEDIPVADEDHQQELLRFIEQERRMAREIADEIALIQEFRTRLIADVVTGQLDVRAVAASLPEVAEAEATEELADDDDLGEYEDELAPDFADEEAA